MTNIPPLPLDKNENPVPAVWVPNTGWVVQQGGTASTDTLSVTSAPVAETGGGGGGGAVTIANGSDTAQGATTDSAATDSTSAWSEIALLKGVYSTLNGVVSVNPGQFTLWSMQSNQSGNSNGSAFYILGYASLITTITMTGFTGTVNFETTLDGTNWVPVYCVQLDTDTLTNRPVTSTIIGSTSTSIHLYQTDISGLQSIRARTSNVSAGTVGINSIAAALPFTDHVTHSITCATPLTSGGTGGFHLISAASTNATSIKATPGQVYGYEIANTNAAYRFVKLYDLATTPTVGTSTVRRTIGIPPNSRAFFHTSTGITFNLGIALATVTGIADNNTTAVGASDLSIDIDYL